MTWSSAVTSRSVFGNKRIVMGTFSTTSTETGGDVATGLKRVEFFSIQLTGTAVDASAPVVNETFPFSGGDVTIVHTASADGIWFAIGI